MSLAHGTLPQLITNPPHFPSSLTIKLLKIELLYCILLNSKTSKYPDNEQLFMTNYYFYVYDEPFPLGAVKVMAPPWKMSVRFSCGMGQAPSEGWVWAGLHLCRFLPAVPETAITGDGASGRWGRQSAPSTKGSHACIPAWNWAISVRFPTFSVFEYVMMKA